MYRITLYDGPNDTEGMVIHSPYVNKVKIDFDIDLVLEGVSSMDFTIDAKNPAWGKVRNLNTLIKVRNVRKKKTIFDGRVLMPSESMSSDGMFTIKYVCEDKKAYLNDYRPRYAKIQNTTVYNLFAFLINRHNELAPPHKHFKVGNVTVKNNTDNVYRYVLYGTTYEEIKDKLIDRLGGYLVLREEVDGTYIDYLEKVGVVKNAPIKLRDNLQDMRRDIDPTDIITRIIPLGARLEAPEGQTEDASMPRLDIKSVNSGRDYIDDPALIAEFEIIEGVLELDDVNTPSILKLRGEQFLEQQKAAKNSYEVTALNMYLKNPDLDDYEVGHWYPIKNQGFLINENLQIIGKKINGKSPQKDKLIIGEKHITLTEYQVQANKSAKRARNLQETVTRQSNLIGSLNNQVSNVNKVVDTITIQFGEADLPGLKQAVTDLNTANATLQETVKGIKVPGPATQTTAGTMSAEDKKKLDEMKNYEEATDLTNGLLSAADKKKLDLITVTSSIDLNDLVDRLQALENPPST